MVCCLDPPPTRQRAIPKSPADACPTFLPPNVCLSTSICLISITDKKTNQPKFHPPQYCTAAVIGVFHCHCGSSPWKLHMNKTFIILQQMRTRSLKRWSQSSLGRKSTSQEISECRKVIIQSSSLLSVLEVMHRKDEITEELTFALGEMKISVFILLSSFFFGEYSFLCSGHSPHFPAHQHLGFHLTGWRTSPRGSENILQFFLNIICCEILFPESNAIGCHNGTRHLTSWVTFQTNHLPNISNTRNPKQFIFYAFSAIHSHSWGAMPHMLAPKSLVSKPKSLAEMAKVQLCWMNPCVSGIFLYDFRCIY